MAEGACRDPHPGVTWFPGPGERSGPAQAVCEGCPVRWPCLDYALADESLDGVWGGTTTKERKRLRRDGC